MTVRVVACGFIVLYSPECGGISKRMMRHKNPEKVKQYSAGREPCVLVWCLKTYWNPKAVGEECVA